MFKSPYQYDIFSTLYIIFQKNKLMNFLYNKDKIIVLMISKNQILFFNLQERKILLINEIVEKMNTKPIKL